MVGENAFVSVSDPARSLRVAREHHHTSTTDPSRPPSLDRVCSFCFLGLFTKKS